jgi:hypothetical protein
MSVRSCFNIEIMGVPLLRDSVLYEPVNWTQIYNQESRKQFGLFQIAIKFREKIFRSHESPLSTLIGDCLIESYKCRKGMDHELELAGLPVAFVIFRDDLVEIMELDSDYTKVQTYNVEECVSSATWVQALDTMAASAIRFLSQP